MPDLDPAIAALAELVSKLAEQVSSAVPGRLGVSSTGLAGDVDANLESLLTSANRLQALAIVAGTRADAENESWRGMRSLLRSAGKASGGEVAAAVRAGNYCVEHRMLGELWVAGSVSAVQVRRIGDLALRVPSEHRDAAVTVLAHHAPNLTDRQLGRAAAVLLNAVVPGWSERDAEQTERASFFSIYPDATGYVLSGHLTNEQAGWVRTAMDAETNVIASGETRSFTELQADVLVNIMRTYAASDAIPTMAMARPTFVVLATATDLAAMAADAAPGDFATSTYGDLLDVVTTRRMLSEADIVPVLAADTSTDTNSEAQLLVDIAFDPATARRVRQRLEEELLTRRQRSRRHAQKRGAPPAFLRLLTTPVLPLAYGRSMRIVPGALRQVVALRDQHCVVPGCDVPAHRCEVHHVQPWALGGATDIDNLALLCVRHHRSVESGKWQLRPRTPQDSPGGYWVAA